LRPAEQPRGAGGLGGVVGRCGRAMTVDVRDVARVQPGVGERQPHARHRAAPLRCWCGDVVTVRSGCRAGDLGVDPSAPGGGSVRVLQHEDGRALGRAEPVPVYVERAGDPGRGEGTHVREAGDVRVGKARLGPTGERDVAAAGRHPSRRVRDGMGAGGTRCRDRLARSEQRPAHRDRRRRRVRHHHRHGERGDRPGPLVAQHHGLVLPRQRAADAAADEHAHPLPVDICQTTGRCGIGDQPGVGEGLPAGDDGELREAVHPASVDSAQPGLFGVEVSHASQHVRLRRDGKAGPERLGPDAARGDHPHAGDDHPTSTTRLDHRVPPLLPRDWMAHFRRPPGSVASVRTDDVLGPPYEQQTIQLATDFEGEVVATLVRLRAPAPTHRAVLYLHGYVDYFFQTHLAEFYTSAGFDFYALDLRKHGRSLRAHQTPNYCSDLSEYYPEIDEAVRIIRETDNHDILLLNGHSTGGLIGALWAHDRRESALIQGLFLNSPFFRFNEPALVLHTVGRLVNVIGARRPLRKLPQELGTTYGLSIHRDHHGEWAYDLA